MMHDQRMEDGMKDGTEEQARPVKDVDILDRFDYLLEMLDYNLGLEARPQYLRQLQLVIDGVEGALARFNTYVYERD